MVTPHAAFLALRWRPHAALAHLRRLETRYRAFTRWGFVDAVGVNPSAGSRVLSPAFLSLDQGMIMAALGNALGRDVLRKAFRHAGPAPGRAPGDDTLHGDEGRTGSAAAAVRTCSPPAPG